MIIIKIMEIIKKITGEIQIIIIMINGVTKIMMIIGHHLIIIIIITKTHLINKIMLIKRMTSERIIMIIKIIIMEIIIKHGIKTKKIKIIQNLVVLFQVGTKHLIIIINSIIVREIMIIGIIRKTNGMNLIKIIIKIKRIKLDGLQSWIMDMMVQMRSNKKKEKLLILKDLGKLLINVVLI